MFTYIRQPMSRNRGSVPCLALLLTLSTFSGCDSSAPASTDAESYFPLREMMGLHPLDEVDRDLDGRILLINFWATWCAPCRREMPDLQKLSDRLDRDRYAVIGVSVDSDGHLAREFLLDHRIRFANFQDHAQRIAGQLLDIRVFPQTYIVDPSGKILAQVSGEHRWDESLLMRLLGGSGSVDTPTG